MTAIMRFGAILLMLAMSGGCSYQRLELIQPALFVEQHREFDLDMGWNTTREGTSLIVTGYVKNIRYFIMQDLELQIATLDAKGNVMARQSYAIIPTSLGQGDSSRFSVRLPSKPGTESGLRFQYNYRAFEGADMSLSWMNSFDTLLKVSGRN